MLHLARLARPVSHVLILMMVTLSIYVPAAHAGLISTETALHTERAQADRERVRTFLARADVRTYLGDHGVAPDDALARVDALTDDEVQQITGKLDQLPAGGDFGGDLLFVALVVFIVLLVTDILGYTDVFPFVKKHAR